jgi:hypothetical protein
MDRWRVLCADGRSPASRLAAGGIAVATLYLALHGAAVAQPCNPVIDGTYCAEQMPSSRTFTTSPLPSMSPIKEIGDAISVGRDTPGTFGGITFRDDGTNCIGLLRRGSCK